MKHQRRFFNLNLNNTKHFIAKTNNTKFFSVFMEFLRVSFKFKTNENVKISGLYKVFKYRKLKEFDPQTLEQLDKKTLNSMDKEEV